MAHDETTCWVVQGGPRGRHVEAYTTGSMVSIAGDVETLGDLRDMADADVFLLLEALGRRKPAEDLRDLRIFTDRIGEGDLVVVHDTGLGDLLFGEVVSPYEYAVLSGEHRHQRQVRWFGRLAEDKADPMLVKGLRVRQPVKRLPEQLHWQRLAREVEDFLGRPIDDVPVRTATVRRSGGGGRRTALPRTPAKPAPVLTPDKLCPSCGLLRAPSMFPDGDEWCRDCA
ncbi:hypothetical protein BH23ACT9_BH23ACT9_22650 [soil metagenome]